MEFSSSDRFRLQAEKIERDVVKYHEDFSAWTDMKLHKGIQVSSRPSPHFQGALYKFECELDFPDELLYEVMKPPVQSEQRLSWDKSIKDYSCFREISEDLIIGIIITHPVMMGLIAMREFVDLYYFQRNLPSTHKDYDRISWIFAEKVELDERPVTKKYVRACNYPTGYGVARCRSDPNKSRLYLYVNCDIGGMLPRSLVESALPSQQIAYIDSVKKQAQHLLNSKK